MHMSYWFGTSVGDLLFKGFTITTAEGLVATCFGLASVAVLFEGVKVYQAYSKQQIRIEDEHCHSSKCASETSSLISDNRKENAPTSRWATLFQETMWYVIQVVMSYILMLCVMTYNGYFTMAVSFGAGLGYLVFGPVLLEIGMKSGGIRRPKRECKVCLEAALKNLEQDQLGTSQQLSSTEETVHCAVPVIQEDPVPQQSEESHCHKSVVQVHRVDA